MPGISVPIFRVRNGPKEYIDKNQFNWLNTIFYLFFLGFEWPQNLAMQYLPVGKWMRYVLLFYLCPSPSAWVDDSGGVQKSACVLTNGPL